MQTSRIFLFSRANSRSPLQKKRHINHIIPLRAGRNAALVSALTTCIMELETDDLSGCGEPITLEGVAFSHPSAKASASLPRTILRASLPAQQHHFPTKSASPPVEGNLASRHDPLPALRPPTFFGALRLVPLFPTPTTIFPSTKNNRSSLWKNEMFSASG
jgi:hypothetical protein